MRLQLLMTWLVLIATASALHAAPVPLVTQGQASAVVVLADHPTATSRYAAQELVSHIERATGVTLPIVRESEIPPGQATRIYLGQTRALAQQGINVAGLHGDAHVLRVEDGRVYIAGRENVLADPLDDYNNPHSGTLFGVYDLLEQFVGVRWLWPGEMGTYVPRTYDISLPPMDKVAEPKLSLREYRWRTIQGAMMNHRSRIPVLPVHLRLTFSSQGSMNYGRDLNAYMRRHRIGHSNPAWRQMHFGHSFGPWWAKYGKDHPDWFMMNEDGQRGPVHGGDSATMNVANPELHRFLVEKAWDGGDYIDLGEADIGNYDLSPESRAWDGPQPRPLPDGQRYSRVLPQPHVTSDRYARFWKTIHEMAAAKNPNVVIATLLYVGYFPAPLMDIKLNDRIIGSFCAWRAGHGYSWDMWFPEPEDRMDWFRDQWTGWRETGITMELRPNTPLAGYVLPRVDTWQGGEFFQFAWRNGMKGADYTSLTGQWAVRGIEEYMYFRLFADPELPIAIIRKEFLEAFGPAARDVGRYFDHWEQYQYTLREQDKWAPYWSGTGRYPQADFVMAEAILADALDTVRKAEDVEFRQRVEFLQAGLHHAKLTSRFIDLLHMTFDGRGKVIDEKLVPIAGEALKELARLRHVTEDRYIADFMWLEILERRRMREIQTLLTRMGEIPSSQTPGKVSNED